MPGPAETYLPLSQVAYLILLSLSEGEKHGYAIIKDVEERTEGRVELEAGTLYAAIKRFRDDELIRETPGPEGTDARRRYYGLTELGRDILTAESGRLAELVKLAEEARVLPSRPTGLA